MSQRSPLSRREFLKRAGITAWAPLLAGGVSPLVQVTQAETMGRAFSLTPVHTRPDEASPVSGQLLPDSTTPINGLQDRWYQIPGGYVPRETLQPIEPYQQPRIEDQVGDGFWAELVAPYGAIRAWCAGSAPILTRLGFGAVVYVMDRMIASANQVWYGLTNAPGSDLTGWAPALHYSRWTPDLTPRPISRSIRIDGQRSELTAYEGTRPVMRTAIHSAVLVPTTTTLRAVQPGTRHAAKNPLGVPWLMVLGTGQDLYGAFWHNRFGLIGTIPDIELSVASARWLYSWIMDDVLMVEVS
jgi:hypothetical protein